MRLTAAFLLVCAPQLFGQQPAASIPTYRSYEEYCYANPKAPTCINGKPLTMVSPAILMKPAPAMNTAQRIQPAIVRPRAVAAIPSPAPAMIRIGDLDLRFAHPQPDMIVGINVSSLLKSRITRTILEELASRQGLNGTDLGAMLEAVGDVDQICVSVKGADYLLMLTGRLNSIPDGSRPGQNVRFLRVAGDKILAGSEASLADATRRMADPARIGTRMQRILAVSEGSDFWVSGTPAALTAYQQNMSRTSGVTHFGVGLSLNADLRMNIVLDTISAEVAQHMATTAQQHPEPNTTVSVAGRSVRMNIILDEATLKTGMANVFAGPFGKQLVPMLASVRSLSKPAAAAQPTTAPSNKVMIFGLEDGPKEVKLDSKP
jgi:hypothetical protein